MRKILQISLLAALCGCDTPWTCPANLVCTERRDLDTANGQEAGMTQMPINEVGDLLNVKSDPLDMALAPDAAVEPSDLAPPPAPHDMATIPETCADVLAADPRAGDGAYTIYANKNANKPWDVYCLDMKNGKPTEYLPLVHTGLHENFSQYTAGGASPGTDVRTNYAKLRIDPKTFLVDVSDRTFATSSGQISEAGGGTVTSMAYAAAMDCAPQGWSIPTGLGNIDLRGTPLTVKPGIFGTGPSGSSHLVGKATYSQNNQVIYLTGGGLCGFLSASPATYGKFGSPMNGAGTFQLQLVYP